jgi:phosphatidylglycerol:prolipoprotein diacylglycerol transferase
VAAGIVPNNGVPGAPPQPLTPPPPYRITAMRFFQRIDSMPLAVLTFPNFKPVLFEFGPYTVFSHTIGPFAIRWYALSYICGILLGWVYARAIIANERRWGGGPAPFTVVEFDDFVLWVTFGIILGGRIGYVLFYNFPHFREDPVEIFKVWHGGMSFHGGFLGCVLAVVLFGLRRDISILSLGDITCAVAPIGLFLGRLANFVNGELWGRPAPDVPWAMVFPADPDQVARHPSQLYEATLEGLGLLLILNLMIRRGALRHPGLVIGAFAMIYAVMRAFCEIFRQPDKGLEHVFSNSWDWPTMGQLLSVPLFLIGVGFAVVALGGNKLRGE